MQFSDVIGQHEARERLLQLVAEQRVPTLFFLQDLREVGS